MNNSVTFKLATMVSAIAMLGTLSVSAQAQEGASAPQFVPQQMQPMMPPPPAFYRGYPRYNNNSMPFMGNWGRMPWGGNNYNNIMRGRGWAAPWSGARDTPWNIDKWVPPMNNGWGRNNDNTVWGSGPQGWMSPGDPKEGIANAWEDMLNAPNRMGRMPGGWHAPSVSVPNPVDVGDEFSNAMRDLPNQMKNFKTDF